MLSRVNGLNTSGTAAMKSAFWTAAGLTQEQYNSNLTPVATAYQTALTANHVAYNNLRVAYSKSAQSVPASAALQNLIQARAALPATYFSQVRSALPSAFASLDSYAGQYYSSMDYCYGAGDDDGYDGCDLSIPTTPDRRGTFSIHTGSA